MNEHEESTANARLRQRLLQLMTYGSLRPSDELERRYRLEADKIGRCACPEHQPPLPEGWQASIRSNTSFETASAYWEEP